MTALLFVRHGESTWNAARRWQGSADPPLSRRGVQQAVDAAASLALLEPFDHVFTSSLLRARRTGELISDILDVPLGESVSELDERGAGPWEGFTRDEIEAAFPGYLQHGRRPVGYEDDASVLARAIPAVNDLVAQLAGSRIVVVSHGGVINALERELHTDSSGTWERIDNLEGRWFTTADGAIRATGPRLSLLQASSTALDDEYA